MAPRPPLPARHCATPYARNIFHSAIAEAYKYSLNAHTYTAEIESQIYIEHASGFHALTLILTNARLS